MFLVWQSVGSTLVVRVGVPAAGFEQQRIADVVREQFHRIVLGCGARRRHAEHGSPNAKGETGGRRRWS